jgi:arsenate reductase
MAANQGRILQSHTKGEGRMDRNILFLCTGNSARSQMAEALLKKHAGNHFQVYSAGLEPKAQVFPPVALAMREIGIDISGQKPKGVEQFLGRVHFEKVIVVCGHAEEKCPIIFGMAPRLFWPFDDPAAATGSEDDILAVCRRVRDQLNRRILEWLGEEGLSIQP